MMEAKTRPALVFLMPIPNKSEMPLARSARTILARPKAHANETAHSKVDMASTGNMKSKSGLASVFGRQIDALAYASSKRRTKLMDLR